MSYVLTHFAEYPVNNNSEIFFMINIAIIKYLYFLNHYWPFNLSFYCTCDIYFGIIKIVFSSYVIYSTELWLQRSFLQKLKKEIYTSIFLESYGFIF